MFLTEAVIWEALDTANCILEATISSYKRPIIKFVKFSRATSWWAQIEKNPFDETFGLKISEIFNEIEDSEAQKNKLISTLIHECIHTIPGCWNHKKKFKAIAALVNSHWPSYWVSTSSSLGSLVAKPSSHKYCITCNHCGQRNLYMRKPKIWDFCKFVHTPYTCNICGHDSFRGEQL